MITISEKRGNTSAPSGHIPTPAAPLNCAPAEPSAAFLSCVWKHNPHHQQLAFRKPESNTRYGTFVESPANAAVLSVRKSKAGEDAFFAPASFKSKESRKADNATGAGSLWVDIDVGPDKAANGSGYGTIGEALAELYIFCTAADIPRPTIVVCSGSGLHVYWVLHQFIGPKLWLMLASKLKAMAKHLNFRADPSRTADITSLLRVPGTLNYKYTPPRPVELISATENPITLCVIAEAITAAYDRLVGDIPQKPSNGCVSFERVDMALLEAILRCLDPDMTYCDWFRVAAAMFNYTGGNEAGYELFDSWSSGGNKYKGAKDTRRLWNSLNPDCPKPITLGTLRWMIEQAGYSWDQDVVAVSDMGVQS
jgi:hypothetical protein